MDKIFDKPLVSVIIPTYNNGDLIVHAINSVLTGSYHNYEIIVIDNYSDDDTDTVVGRYAHIYDNIRYFKFHNHGLVAASRNYGVDNSKGTLIAFLDSDDVWTEDKLRRAVESFSKDPDIDYLCHHELLRRNGTIEQVLRHGPKTATSFKNFLFEGNVLSTSAVVIKRDVFKEVGGFDTSPQFQYAEDYELWLRLAFNRYRVEIIPEVLGEFRQTGKNFGRYVERQFQSIHNITNLYFSKIEDESPLDRIRLRMRLAELYRNEAVLVHRKGERTKAMELSLKSLKTWPFHPKIYPTIGVISLNYHRLG